MIPGVSAGSRRRASQYGWLGHANSLLTRKNVVPCAIVFAVLLLVFFAYRWIAYLFTAARFASYLSYHMAMTPDFDVNAFPEHQLSQTAATSLGYTAVVLYLVNANRLREMILSLYYLSEHVPMHPWPILLLHSEDLDNSSLRKELELRVYNYIGPGEKARAFVRRIEWLRLEWHLPEGFPTDKAEVDPVFEHAWPGYHLMCGFFAKHIFEHPRLADVTYYMRLDTDSYIFAPLCYDPVARAHAHNISYAHRMRTTDPGWVTNGMWSLVDDYARAHPDVEGRLEVNGWRWPEGSAREHSKMEGRDFPTYYNNFEIVKLERFRRPEVRAWLEELMSVPERVYKYRWGDAPIRYATLNMFFDAEKDVEEYCGMRYWHNGMLQPNCACDPR